jgi:hypothetical protein
MLGRFLCSDEILYRDLGIHEIIYQIGEEGLSPRDLGHKRT